MCLAKLIKSFALNVKEMAKLKQKLALAVKAKEALPDNTVRF